MVVFFFKQKTAYEMRISDWSSDVCSSDLIGLYQTAIGTPRRMDGEVTATRCQIDVPCLKKLVMLGKRDLRRAMAVKPCRQGGRKASADMLNDHCRGAVGGPVLQKLNERLHATRGRAYCNEIAVRPEFGMRLRSEEHTSELQ